MSTSQTAAMSGVQPHFLSRGHTYRAVVGDTLVLPCQVENLVFEILISCLAERKRNEKQLSKC
ncbi:unnamed protein product [Ceratitis capitata]|uniref:(Mediterranean fruit fly) hypothetical protein n=1 Tax=Ceratitis capitata TaxID=7213 RepID=A0A811U7S3_CERCA|nr:unnamed protein product [Ceratitis capitata]